MRLPDPEVPPDEDLFRGLAASHVREGEIDPRAIDLEGMSVQRSRYIGAESMRSEERPMVAVIRGADLPEPQTVNGVEWEAFVFDCPSMEEGEGHAEIRFRRTSDRASPENGDPSKAVKKRYREILPSRFRVLPP